MNQLSVVNSLTKLEGPFGKQNTYGLKFESECLFAKQQLVKNDYTVSTAQNNPNSLKAAIMNVAAIGISLNPASAHAYLVPRDGSICLDVSYRGLVKLATDSGSIEWAKAVLVYESDTFVWKGPAEAPIHEADVFNNTRVDASNPMKTLVGGYCLAKLAGGGYMVDTMTSAEIGKVQQSSKAKNGPWRQWPEEMAKKTLVKRAYKSWPQSGGRARLDQAIEVLNHHEGLETVTQASVSDYLKPSPDQTQTYLKLAEGDPVDFCIWYYSLDQRIQAGLPDMEFKRGEKGALMKKFNAAIQQGRDTLDAMKLDIISCCDSQDEAGIVETMEDLPENQKQAIIDTLNIEQASFVMDALI